MEVLQTSALPLGDGAPLTIAVRLKPDTTYYVPDCTWGMLNGPDGPDNNVRRAEGDRPKSYRFDQPASEASGATGPHEAKDASRLCRYNQCQAAKGGEGTGARSESDSAPQHASEARGALGPHEAEDARGGGTPRFKVGAGNGIRTRDFDLGKVALYH